MTYLILYIAAILAFLAISRVGWSEAIKLILSVLIPSILIILFNVKAGKLLFKNPALGIISFLPTAILIFKSSRPVVDGINSWIDRTNNTFVNSKDVIDAELISKEDA